jgi:hypothetical protein
VLLLLASMIGLGLVAGFLARGTLEGLKEIHFKLVWLLFLSLVVAIIPLFSDTINKYRRPLLLIAMTGVLVFLIVNILTSEHREIRAGLLIIAVGWALNFTVIALNRGMPLSRWAYARSGQAEVITAGKGGFYRAVVAGPHTKLRFLGDVIPVRLFHQVVSIGDICLVLGIAFVIAAAMRTVKRGAPVEQPAQ